MEDRVYSVSEFNKIVKNYLEENPVLVGTLKRSYGRQSIQCK